MAILNVDLGSRSYAIHVGDALTSLGNLINEVTQSPQIMIVSNETVAPLYLATVSTQLEGRNVQSCILKDGEQYKTLTAVEQVVSALLEAKFDRGCTLIALGGGVVGDITGFSAASYQRGVNFIQIPTTLLAQVDSSVGGKTGVNHPLGKNMIGAFYQPRLVLADISTLSTLPPRELSAGIAEVIKYGLISKPDFFSWLEENIERLLSRDPDALSYAITVSCQTKADIVAADEKESGVRALLNLGHTFGHAIETALGYGKWLHGEAVACGMCMAADLSQRHGWLSHEDSQRVVELIRRAQLPTQMPSEIEPHAVETHMKVDKKNRDGVIRLILLKGLGRSFISDDYDRDLLKSLLFTPNQ